MNEAETRAEHIDPALAAAGWGVVTESRIRREFSIVPGRIEGRGKRGKALTADYVLEYRGIKLAVIEAKSWNEEVTEGVAQAKNYANKLAIRFAYSTNGKGIYAIDTKTGKESEQLKYPTPDELWAKTFAEENAKEKIWRDRFAAVQFSDKSGSWAIRFYQELAVNRVLEAIAANKNRILLTLATGTGKTSIAFQIIWKLFQSRWNLSHEPSRRPRVLFLADRNILANQARNDFTSFAAFEDNALERISPDEIKKKGRVPTNASIFFTIFQTFMSGPLKDGQPSPYFGDYPKDFFDLIVIDECHRGGANDEGNWRAILDYFSPAVQLGLTATPKRKDNVDTYAYFGEPVYVYSLKEGINDGFLTPFRDIVLLRPVTNMIEFKQIIGRGTRLFDNKDYFTIYDFVKAHHRFIDNDWDGDPIEPEICSKCGTQPCICETKLAKPCALCDKSPCECEKEPCSKCAQLRCICRKKIKVKLADNKERTIQSMSVTSFWHPNGTPMSSQQFMETLFGKLPEFFKNEEELRELWSQPDTRAKLLQGLAEKGFGRDQLEEMQKVINAEKSDLFDVLAHVAYALPALSRKDRATNAKVEIANHFNSKQQEFLNFVLEHYTQTGVEELEKEKLTPLLRIRYGAINDATSDLGSPAEIRLIFSNFQRYLYQSESSGLRL
jgi:type I site-specific restriction endonuclease